MQLIPEIIAAPICFLFIVTIGACMLHLQRRRRKINEKFKTLQQLVPGCDNKVKQNFPAGLFTSFFFFTSSMKIKWTADLAIA